MSPKSAMQKKTGEETAALWWKPVMEIQKEVSRNLQHMTPGFTPAFWGDDKSNIFGNWQKQVNRMFGEMFNTQQMFVPWLRGGHTEPYVDIIENTDHFTVKADVPGVDADDLDVSVSGNALTIKGHREEVKEDVDEKALHRECSSGYFSRTIALPEDADLEKADVTFERNVLNVRVPKKVEGGASSRSRKLKISTSAQNKKAA